MRKIISGREHTCGEKAWQDEGRRRFSEKKREMPVPRASGTVLSLDSAVRRVYTFWIHFLLRSNLMAHKKIERAKELDRRRHRRAQRIKERIHEAKAAAKK